MIGAVLVFVSVSCLSAFAIEFKKPPTLDERFISHGHYEGRIVGGEDATIEEHPYQISFIVDQKYFCGGFIVSENYILTAGHCSTGADAKTVLLRAGSTFRTNGTVIPIAEVITHPEYDNPQLDKDVGIMKTAEPIQFTDVIQPIKLPVRGTKLEPKSNVVVSGWGKTNQAATSIPERLKHVTIPVVPDRECRLAYYDVLTDNMWCGGNFFFGGKSACQGDSGGAAVQDGVAVGIVSFGRICGQPLAPTVFAYISSPDIRDFIAEHTGL